MNWKDVGKKLLNIGVPILGTALGGPVGGIAAKAAISLISSKFGIEEENLTPEIVTTMLGNPDDVFKLRELEIDGEVELRRLMNQESEMYLSDRQDARKMHTETTKTTGSRDINLYVMAYIIIFGFFTLTGMMYFVTLPQSNVGPVNQLFGVLITIVAATIGYFYGTSKSSADKTKLMAGK